MNFTPALHTFLLTLGYTVFGIVIFGVAFWLITKLVPFSMRKEIEEDQNTALAILVGAVLLGLAIIIAATIHG
jgi:putative membrane protein